LTLDTRLTAAKKALARKEMRTKKTGRKLLLEVQPKVVDRLCSQLRAVAACGLLARPAASVKPAFTTISAAPIHSSPIIRRSLRSLRSGSRAREVWERPDSWQSLAKQRGATGELLLNCCDQLRRPSTPPASRATNLR